MSTDDKFCATCGSRLVMRQQEGRVHPVCPECGRVVYYDPKLAATCVVERDDRVLFVQRAMPTGYGLWSLPGGYVDRGELVEDAAAREVYEETGLQVVTAELIGVFSQAQHPVVVVAYSATETGGELIAGPECLDLGFFAPDALPPLAFPRDAEIVRRKRSMPDDNQRRF
ncbi:MAG: NUDIX hydrolase [Chloroflexi bacterium]|nr:NUDIX hydrolase [Chloroflexota bacterium]